MIETKEFKEVGIPTTSRAFSSENSFSDRHYGLGTDAQMFDIDSCYLDSSNKIKYILEDKYTFKTNKKYAITDKKNYQRNSIRDFAKDINSELILNETSTDKWCLVDNYNRNVGFDKKELEKLTLLDTSNRIYLEVRKFKTKAIICIFDRRKDIENERKEINQLKPLLDKLGDKYPLYYVEILGDFHFKYYKMVSGKWQINEIKNIEEWISFYKEIGLK